MTEPAASTNMYAGFWVRVGAALIDSFLAALILVPIVWAVYGPQYFSSDTLLAGPLDFLLTWVLPAVAVILFWVYKSATPGKMALGLKIVDARTGELPSTGQCIGRYLGCGSRSTLASRAFTTSWLEPLSFANVRQTDHAEDTRCNPAFVHRHRAAPWY
jgi:uncharacterized RDD family membrane protein YckC